MDFFNKEKGLVWGLVNGIALFLAVGCAVAILAILIFSGFNFSFWGLRAAIWCLVISIALIMLALFIINKKCNLLDRHYPISRRLFNGLFILATIIAGALTVDVLVVLLVSAIQGAALNDAYVLILSVLAPFLTCILTVVLANIKPILISSNSKALNVVNFFSLYICSNLLMAIFEVIIQIIYKTNRASSMSSSYYRYSKYTYDAGNDWKLVIFLVCVVLGLGILIYFLNFKKKKNHDKSLPKTFNDTKKSIPTPINDTPSKKDKSSKDDSK